MTSHDPQLLKGVLPMLVLSQLETDAYGYLLVTRLNDIGLADVRSGSVYPLLTRLEREGLIDSYLEPSPSGPARKYYTLTDSGRAELAAAQTRWHELGIVVDRALKGSDPS